MPKNYFDSLKLLSKIQLICYQTKQSLVYELQEHFRFLAELTILKAIRSKQLDINDFYFTVDDYHYKFNPESKHKALDIVMRHYGGQPSGYSAAAMDKMLIIKVEIESMTGKYSGWLE